MFDDSPRSDFTFLSTCQTMSSPCVSDGPANAASPGTRLRKQSQTPWWRSSARQVNRRRSTAAVRVAVIPTLQLRRPSTTCSRQPLRNHSLLQSLFISAMSNASSSKFASSFAPYVRELVVSFIVNHDELNSPVYRHHPLMIPAMLPHLLGLLQDHGSPHRTSPHINPEAYRPSIHLKREVKEL